LLLFLLINQVAASPHELAAGDASKPTRSTAFGLFNMPVNSLHRAVSNRLQLISLAATHRTSH